MSEENRTQKCSTCGEVKARDAENFSRDKNLVTGLSKRCRICARLAAAAWQNSEAGRESNRRYARSERGREMERLRRAKSKQKQTKEN